MFPPLRINKSTHTHTYTHTHTHTNSTFRFCQTIKQESSSFGSLNGNYLFKAFRERC